MIKDKLLSFEGTSSNTYATVDLGKAGALLMGDEYTLVVERIATVAAGNAGTWTLTTSDDNFSNSTTLASGAVAAGTGKAIIARLVLPFKPLAKLRLTVAATSGTGLNLSMIAGHLVSGPVFVDEEKNAVAA